MRRLLVLPLLLVAFAGCLDSDDSGAATDSDGDGFTDQQEIDAGSDPLDATSTPADARVEESVSFSDSGLILVGNEDVANGEGCGYLDAPDTAAWTWTIAAPEGSTGAQVTDLVFTGTYPVSMAEGDIYVFDPTGALITQTTTFAPGAPGVDGFKDTVTAAGPYQAGDFLVEIRGCLGSGSVSMDATGTLSYITA